MGGKKGDSLTDLEKTMDDAMAELDGEDSAPEPKPTESSEPAMEEVSASPEPTLEAEPAISIEADDTLADDLLGEDLDLSQESVVDAELDGLSLEVDDTETLSEEAPVEPELEEDDDDVGAFSLDDFAPENFDEDEEAK